MRARNSLERVRMRVDAIAFVVSIAAISALGAGLGFLAGLVPGLHMNNIAAALTAYSGASIAFVAVFGDVLAVDELGLLAACLVASAMTGHAFAEAITSAYVGIPAEDVVSVLPAHRLARAGLGGVAVRAGADGTMAGLLFAALLIVPVCFIMGPPVDLYSHLRRFIGLIVVLFSIVLLTSEMSPSLASRNAGPRLGRALAKTCAVFGASGVIGSIVLLSGYCWCDLPDAPWLAHRIVSPSSLLLPMFAGLFGVPGLLLSLGSRAVPDAGSLDMRSHRHRPGVRDLLLSFSGGILVGWMPGMTSGSAVTVCAPSLRDSPDSLSIAGSSRFIWLYSAISSSGAVFSLGALFVIMRARSGSMDALQFFLRMEGLGGKGADWGLPMSVLLLSIVLSAILSVLLLERLSARVSRVERVLLSRRVTIASLVFICGLSVALTGIRGGMLMVACTSLGLIPPLIGVRRIQLMGCLLVPVALTLLRVV